MSRIDESVLKTKQQYEECFLSEVCEYLDRNKYLYRVMYREWVDPPNVPITYDGGNHQTRCDLAIFLLVDQKPIRIFINFKVNQYLYRMDYRSQSLWRDAKNGVRKRDGDYQIARLITREDRNSIYVFAIKNLMENSDPNNYKNRILTCGFAQKNTVIGAAIRSVLHDQNQKKPEKK